MANGGTVDPVLGSESEQVQHSKSFKSLDLCWLHTGHGTFLDTTL